MDLQQIQPGDIIRCPFGIDRTPEEVVVQSVHHHGTRDVSIRFRYAENPRGIDWSGFIAKDETVELLARVGFADQHTRSLLP